MLKEIVMNKVFLVCGLGLFLAGCNATVYTPRPMVIDLETRPPVYVPRNYHLPPPRYYGHRCATVWDRTHRGYVERRVCGNHIP
jgi:hypothetical protein